MLAMLRVIIMQENWFCCAQWYDYYIIILCELIFSYY